MSVPQLRQADVWNNTRAPVLLKSNGVRLKGPWSTETALFNNLYTGAQAFQESAEFNDDPWPIVILLLGLGRVFSAGQSPQDKSN